MTKYIHKVLSNESVSSSNTFSESFRSQFWSWCVISCIIFLLSCSAPWSSYHSSSLRGCLRLADILSHYFFCRSIAWNNVNETEAGVAAEAAGPLILRQHNDIYTLAEKLIIASGYLSTQKNSNIFKEKRHLVRIFMLCSFVVTCLREFNAQWLKLVVLLSRLNRTDFKVSWFRMHLFYAHYLKAN